MNPNATMAARVTPRMMNDIVPPYASALPRFAQQQRPTPVSAQISYEQAVPAPSASPAPVNPMFAPLPQAPAAEPQEQVHTEVVEQHTQDLAEQMSVGLQTEQVAVQAHPDQIQAVPSSPKPKLNWLVITLSILVAGGLMAAAFVAFKQNS